MNNSTKAQTKTEQESQAQRDWQAWQEQHRARREAKGYNVPVSDEEALDILGLL